MRIIAQTVWPLKRVDDAEVAHGGLGGVLSGQSNPAWIDFSRLVLDE
jgi:hypothetical protein